MTKRVREELLDQIVTIAETPRCCDPIRLQRQESMGVRNICYDESGETKPVFFLWMWKAPRVEKSHFRDLQPERSDHSESGWTIGNICQQYLELMRVRFDDGELFLAILVEFQPLDN
jgi:hypothetical protein